MRERKHIETANVDRSLRNFREKRPRRSVKRRRSSASGNRLWRPWRGVVMLAVLAGGAIYGREALVIARGTLIGGKCEVSSVVDGDTVKLFCPHTGRVTARLTGYDTPEVFSPKCISELWRGVQATWTLRKLLWFADEVEIVLTGKDRYDRRLASMQLDGRGVAGLMISKGLARSYSGGQRNGWC